MTINTPDDTNNETEASPLPLDLALKILDIADAKGWYYAPPGDGCYDRDEIEKVLINTKPSCFSLVINYKADYADSVSVSFHQGKITLEIEDNCYYDYKVIDSLDELSNTAWAMLEAYNA